MMKLQTYLDRIGFSASTEVDISCLNRLIEAHVKAIPFENLDILLNRAMSRGVGSAFDKLVVRRRGGWCYEMNALFMWALKEVGFAVRPISAGVRRSRRGDVSFGNHLALIVKLDKFYLVDVGFGGVQLSAVPLIEQVTNHPPVQMALQRLSDGYWRLHEGGLNARHSYDFSPELNEEDKLAERFEFQCHNEDSVFRQNLSVSIRSGSDILRLRGRMLERLKPGRIEKSLLPGPEALQTTLEEHFGIIEPEVKSLWPMIKARHEALFRYGEFREPDRAG